LIKVIETNHPGRLLAYDPVTRTGRTVLSGLYMANGIALSPCEDYLLIAETSICRITRYVKHYSLPRYKILHVGLHYMFLVNL